MTCLKKIVAVLLLVLVSGCFGTPGVWAQSTDAGTLLGVITSGVGNDVLPGAVVHLRNTVTGEMYKSNPADELGMYTCRDVPFGTYDIAVETDAGFYVTSEQVAVKDTVPQLLSLGLSEDKEAAVLKKSTAWWKTPVGIVVISAGTIFTGLVIGNALDDDEEPASPANP